MPEQLAFARLLAEADEQHRATLDRHREQVQIWFDQMPDGDKNKFGEWMANHEWDTCVALSAAACDWHRSKCRTVGR